MDWYLDGLRQYAVFTGRSRRKAYWMFTLVNVVIAVALGIFEALARGPGVVGSLYCLAVLIPGLAVTVRRLHDTDRSGWWVLIGLIPIIGTIVIFVFLAQEGRPGPNQYGPDPKAATA